jgi:peptidoglycan hydrolase-like protein with peptidoglycan-binding domain|tara:strand:+ start:1716 stop:2591 length:876 start_codon:yes stop_codon:yes gene_type:complete
MRYVEFKEAIPEPEDDKPDIPGISPDIATPKVQLKKGPPYPPEQMDQVRTMQSQLQKIGYYVGRTGVDGKYGPRTEKAVSAFKKDYKETAPPNIADDKFLDKLAKVVAGQVPKVTKPTDTGNPKPFGGKELDDLGFGGQKNIEAKKIAEEFLGKEMNDQEWNALIRATVSEASPNSKEQAAVMAVILNRARSSKYPDGIIAVLTQKNQFQAVTGTRFAPGPSKNFSNVSKQSVAAVADATIKHLKRMDKSWLNFTANNPRAYGPGTNIDFMYAMRKSKGASVIGQTVFGTA